MAVPNQQSLLKAEVICFDFRGLRDLTSQYYGIYLSVQHLGSTLVFVETQRQWYSNGQAIHSLFLDRAR